MFCSNCGNEMNSNEKFCGQCGSANPEFVEVNNNNVFESNAQNTNSTSYTNTYNGSNQNPSGFTNNQSEMGSNESSTLAVVSLVLSILSLICCGLFLGIPAIISGFIGLSKYQPGGNRKMCIAAIIIGIIAVIFSIFSMVYMITTGSYKVSNNSDIVLI